MYSRYFPPVTPDDIVGMDPADVLYWAYYENYAGDKNECMKLLAFLIHKEGV